MAVSEQTPYQEFIANGTTTVFPLNFDAKEQDHLIVLLDDVEPPVGEWSFDFYTDQVTFLKAPKANSVIKIRRDTPLKRDGSYKTYDNSFRPEPVNEDLDSIWYKLQEMGVLNWMINNDIKDLGAYVDSLNDETKAAFLAMIEKQGVSMQQLDLYVQGLYKKLANVAVEKGWLAELVVDGDKTQKQINDGLLFPMSFLSQSTNRYLQNHIIDQVNIRDYGAIGDGTLHTVQEWINDGKFSSLVAIQFAFPHVTSLSDSIDWAVTQLCVNMQKDIYAPKGYYISNKAVHFAHSGSPNRVDSSAYVRGDGCKTIFSRNEIGKVATRILKIDGSLDIDIIDDINNEEAVFSVHGSYYKFSDFLIQHSKVGMYFGQDLKNLAEKSACYKNVLRDIQIRRCGTGLLFSAASGNHYNNVSNIHFIENQIDCEIRSGKYDIGSGTPNNNRNYFTNIRSNRAIVGLWCSSGDTNRLTSWDGENCRASPVNNPYPTPVGLPKLSNGNQITNAVHIFSGAGQLNKVLNCQFEACDIELYNDHYRNSFINNGYHEAVENGTQVYMLQEPGVYISHNTFFTPYFCRLLNINLNAFPNISELGFYIRGHSIKNDTGVSKMKASPASKNYAERRVFDVGSAEANGTKTVVLWRDVDPSSSANIKVKVSAISSVGNISYANEIAVTAYRANSKTLTRYFMHELYKLRSTGLNAGDASATIVPTISSGGTSTRELILTLTMPAAKVDSIFVDVDLVVSLL